MNVQNKYKLSIPIALLALTVACTQDQVMDEVTLTPISASSGGVAKSHDGLIALTVPAGALAADTDIRIETKRGLVDGRVVSAVYDLTPHGLTFSTPVQLRLSAKDETRVLDLANLDGADPEVVEGSTHDSSTGVVSAPLAHFSSYGAIVHYDPCAGLQCGDACTRCNPAHPNCMEPPGQKICSGSGQCLPVAAVSCVGRTPDAGVALDAGQVIPDAAVPPPADGGSTPGVLQESEPNDALARPNVVQSMPGATATVHGSINPAGDEDYFMFFVPGGMGATVHGITYSQLGDPSVCNGIDTVLTLFDSRGTVLAMNDDNGTPCSEISTTLAGGMYYFRVAQFAGQTIADYYLDITVTPVGNAPDAGPGPADAGGGFLDAGVPPADAGTMGTNPFPEQEPNDSQNQAQSLPVRPGQVLTVSGAVNPAGDKDIFIFQVAPGGTLHASTYGVLGSPTVCGGIDTYLTVYDGSFNQIASNDDIGSGNLCSDLTVALGTGSVFYVEVRHFDTVRGTVPQYYLDIDIQ